MECCTFATIGSIFLAYHAIKLAAGFYKAVSLFVTANYPDFSKYGVWSVVTGATDGIGKATAIELAKSGQNVVLISRSSEKLEATKSEILEKSKVEVKCIAVDFTDDPEIIYPKIKDNLAGLNIGVLINNVGISYDNPENFLDLPNLSDKIKDIVRANIVSVVKMTEIILPAMIDRKKGLIMNISSASALKPCPMLSLYGASKDFVSHFGQSLSYEYEGDGIHVQTIVPFHVTSKLSKIRRPTLFVPSSKDYAVSMLKTAGKTRYTFGYWSHALQGWAVNMLPADIFASIMLRSGKQLRARAHKKMALKNAKKTE